MVENRLNFSISLVIFAAVLDLLIGDPRWLPHPVEFMGHLINFLRKFIEKWAANNSLKLQIGGTFISFFLLFVSGMTGWLFERIALSGKLLPQSLGFLIVAFALASGLAASSLMNSVKEVLDALPDKDEEEELQNAREKLSHIVGRDVSNLDKSQILRAAAETASENAVDGIFAPLFWMFLGIISWSFSMPLPGPLAMVWIYKAASTLDSMLGYRTGRLLWLGRSGAKLDDLLTWIPCRLVVITLPLISKRLQLFPEILRLTWHDGSKDDSPNSGLSEAVFAYCTGIQMGGLNSYSNKVVNKNIIASHLPLPDKASVEKILFASRKLEFTWLLILFAFCFF